MLIRSWLKRLVGGCGSRRGSVSRARTRARGITRRPGIEALETRTVLAGTAVMIEDTVAGGGIRPGSASSNPGNLTNVNGTLYFQAIDLSNGTELWRINSSGVAEMVEDAVAGGGIRPSSGSSSPSNLTNVNGTLYFQAIAGQAGVDTVKGETGTDKLAGGSGTGTDVGDLVTDSTPAEINEALTLIFKDITKLFTVLGV